MLSWSRLILLAILIAFLQCTNESKVEDPPQLPGSGNVLFVGNSLTYYNDLPKLVDELAEMEGITMNVKTIASPNYALEDHWNEGTIQKALKEARYDYLVAQQGPSALPESQQLLKESSITIANECKLRGARFALYMVWPSLDRDFDRDNCILSYTNAAKATDGLLCPAGLAWKLAWQKDPDLPLYGPDNFHPSIHGSVLAAMVVYASITNKTNVDFIDKSRASWNNEITNEQLAIMKEAAKIAIEKK